MYDENSALTGERVLSRDFMSLDQCYNLVTGTAECDNGNALFEHSDHYCACSVHAHASTYSFHGTHVYMNINASTQE